MRAMKRFDLYRKVPRDLTEPTLSGAVVSCCTVLLALYLFLAEFWVLLDRKWQSEMFIDESRTEDKLQINLDVTLWAMPCELLSFDAQDVMGSHEVDAHGNLWKDRLTSKGDLIETLEIKSSHFGASAVLSRHHSFSYGNEDIESIRKSINSGEGCRIRGHVKVNKVPGNLHLSTYSHSFLFGSLYQETRNLNISHRINHLSFGLDSDISHVKTNFWNKGVVSTLDGVEQVTRKEQTSTTTEKPISPYSFSYGLSSSPESAIFEYYTKVVPTTYVPLDGKEIRVHQFTANTNTIKNQQMPSLYFRYDFSPVTVRYSETKESLSHFLVQICAVVGGIFTVAGLLDSVLHKSIVHLAKKAQIGKLG